MADGNATAATPADATVEGEVTSTSEVKRPADEAARAKEALRAKRRRLEAKLKKAKSEDELRALAKKYAGGATSDDDLETQLAAGPVEPLEPGQKPGWPKPSEVATTEKALIEAIEGSGQFVEFIVGKTMKTQTAEKIVALTVAQCLRDEPGRKLAQAWAPLATLYMPDLLKTPHAAAIIGTLQAGAMIAASINATLDDVNERLLAEQKAKKEAEKAATAAAEAAKP